MQSGVLQFCRAKSLFQPGERVIAAVSGGADSVALLRFLHACQTELQITLAAAHLDHGFRGRSSHEDALFVRDLCRRLGVPCHVDYCDVPGLIARRGGSAQETAREVRTAFLGRLAEAEQADVVAMGHHRDDQAETLLLNLLRGSGLDGLTVMAPRARVGSLTVVRPFLTTSRGQIEDYLAELGQEYRTDASNLKEDYRRNLIRHRVLPLLGEVNPLVSETLARTAELLRDDNEVLRIISAEAFALCVSSSGADVLVNLAADPNLPSAICRRVIRLAWAEISGSTKDFGQEHVRAVFALWEMQPGRQIALPYGHWAVRERDFIRLSRPHAHRDYEVKLCVPGKVELPGGWVLEASTGCEAGLHGVLYRAEIDFSGCELTIRNRRPGDRYQPHGLKGHRKLQDVMSEGGVPLYWRQSIPVVLAGASIIWVPGGRVAEGYRVTKQSAMPLVLSLYQGGLSGGE